MRVFKSFLITAAVGAISDLHNNASLNVQPGVSKTDAFLSGSATTEAPTLLKKKTKTTERRPLIAALYASVAGFLSFAAYVFAYPVLCLAEMIYYVFLSGDFWSTLKFYMRRQTSGVLLLNFEKLSLNYWTIFHLCCHVVTLPTFLMSSIKDLFGLEGNAALALVAGISFFLLLVAGLCAYLAVKSLFRASQALKLRLNLFKSSSEEDDIYSENEQ